MGDADAFADAAYRAARNIRFLPKDLRREMGNVVRDAVAEPMARDIRAAWRGPYRYPLSQATKARVSGDPTVVTSGRTPRLSHGAGPNTLVKGVEFGGGKRATYVNPYTRGGGRSGRRRHGVNGFTRRPGTGMFGAPQHAFFGTVGRNLGRYLDRWADAVSSVIEKGVNR